MSAPVNWRQRFLQQAGWTTELRQYLFRKAGRSAADSLLEVGCGAGAVLGSIPAQVFERPSLPKESAALYGLDINPDHLLQAAGFVPGARLTLGDAHRLPFASASFDLVFCHFTLLWLAQPGEALAEMKRVARPGGWVMALAEPDYGGRIDYPDSLAELGRLQELALRQQGADTRLGRRLQALFQRAGLAELETGILGAQQRGQPAAAELEQEWAVMEADLQGLISAEELARFRQLNRSAWQAGERVLFVPTFYAAGRKRT
jgi:SAM-dependent methyltransferase